MTITQNIEKVRENIVAACVRSHRNPDDITLVAVSKRKSAGDILEAIAAGVQHFGENRVEELQGKQPVIAAHLDAVNPDPIWHMVGHIQSRKTHDALMLFSVIHSLDSLKLARKMNELALENHLYPQLFLQINISGEQQKYGFDGANWEYDIEVRENLFNTVDQILRLDALRVRGLMTMAPFGASEADLRKVFASLATLKSEMESYFSIELPDLSMGMTDDYPIAIEEGATVVRVGRAIFGEREY